MNFTVILKMQNPKLQYSLTAVRKAGEVLIDPGADEESRNHALEVFRFWQECNAYPLSHFYASLTELAKKTPGVNVVQRRKRLEAVEAKLRRYPAMNLGGMNDIAGCRAIVQSTIGLPHLYAFVDKCKQIWSEHELKGLPYDYIERPRDSGYRGIHLIYRFKSTNPIFDGRLIEVQFRSQLQHAWATAVEIVDLFTRQSLKAGGGDPDWLRFFALMGSAIAKLENAPRFIDANELINRETHDELRHYAEHLHVEAQMRSFGSFAQSIDQSFTGISGYSGYSGTSGYFLIELDVNARKYTVRGYSQDDAQKAYLDVTTAERSNPNAVLVAATDLVKLKQAYPNWIIDTRFFLEALNLTLNPYHLL
jgi:hypothetical protein